MSKLGVFIGRFSPFHAGHMYVLQRALHRYDAVVVLVGTSGETRTTKNPWNFLERQSMIAEYVKDYCGSNSRMYSRLRILPLYDYPYNDHLWIKGVQDAVEHAKRTLVNEIGDHPDLYITGADRDRTTWYLNAFGDYFKVDTVPSSPIGMDLSATKVRDILFSGGDIGDLIPAVTKRFLDAFIRTEAFSDLSKEYHYIQSYKAIYANLRYPVSIQTVDTCVIQSGHVLVVVRDNFPGRGLWCLPGGHLDVDKNERLQDAAIRELVEETSIGLSKAQLLGSVRNKECFDHPDRSLKARVITMCYLLRLDDTKPLPKIKPQRGEARKVMWVPLFEALQNRDKWFDDHWHILNWGINCQ